MNSNQAAFERACQLMPGGVNSPVRGFSQVGGTPKFLARGQGPYVWDIEGQRFTDYVGSWGPLILGHAHADVIRAVIDTASQGLGFGAPTLQEIELTELLQRLMPVLEKIRLVSSGTEAVMSAIRLARGVSGRDQIVKFEGCYHGHSDSLLVKAGSGALTSGHPSSLGVPAALSALTHVLPYNDADACERLMAEHGSNIACIVVEPVAGNMNLVAPAPGFLSRLEQLCRHHGSLLIADEVMSGFRVGLGGAVARYGIEPDVVCLGKIIGGGLPVAAFGGKAQWMEQLAPLGGVYQAGTLSGNPVAVAAGIATLKALQTPGFYEQLEQQGVALARGLEQAARAHGVALSAQVIGGMVGVYLSAEVPTTYRQVMALSTDVFRRFFHGLLQRGVYWPPSLYEAAFISICHDHEVIEHTLNQAEAVFQDTKNKP